MKKPKTEKEWAAYFSERRRELCKKINCPHLGNHLKCCPGPEFFMTKHTCHDCQLNCKGDERCLSCMGPSDEPNHQGASVVSIDAMPDGGDSISAKKLDTGSKSGLKDMTDGEADAAHRVLLFFMDLSEAEFRIVRYLLNGGNLNTYAIANNIRRQDAFKMVMRLIKRHPEVRAIVKERKQPNGRVLNTGDANPTQLTLF